LTAAPIDPMLAELIPVHRTIPQLARDPLKGFGEIGRQADGAIVQLNLGLFRPYLITHPAHVQQVLRDRAENYRRDGMLWKPLRRLNGDGIASEGPSWEASRRLIQPLFSGKNVAALIDPMAKEIERGVDGLDGAARSGEALDVTVEMTRIVHRALVRAFFGGRISLDDADALGAAIATAFTSLGSRMLLPFVSESIPLPGDAAFARAVRTVDDVIFPLVRSGRASTADGAAGSDIVSLLSAARDGDGNGLNDRQIRDDVVAMFVAGTETTALVLTWLWVLHDMHPLVAAKLHGEVTRVVGSGPPTRAHLPELRYTKMVLQEVMRLYPVGWIIPRTVRDPDVLEGVRIDGGATVFLSPYLTHRMEDFWPRPDVFDPERFLPERSTARHRFAYFPFGGGIHQCLGSHFFTVEAQLIVASMLSRYRPMVASAAQVTPQASASLRPRGKVEMVLRRIEHRRHVAAVHQPRGWSA
jgi:cytochrome P450